MSEINANAELNEVDARKNDGNRESRLKIAMQPAGRLNRINEWCSEWCSSILVKETRQALKSRQFIWTYFVLLLSVGVWTVLGLTISNDGRGLDYRAGRELLFGFWVILGFPLGLIIPFGAYRSLAREFEDGTIHLISITTMKPYQIVIGKFGSAILQMLIFLSVLAPCILITYMLRGISLEQIMMGLGICVGGSVCLTILGLFLAGAVRSRTLGVGVSVLFVLFLGWIYYGWCEISNELTYYGGRSSTDEPGFSIIVFSIVAFFGSTAGLLLVAATSQISFPSNNRSTAIRIAMLVQQMLFLAAAVMILPMVYNDRDEFCLAMSFVIGHYWLLMGFLMIGEQSKVSRRVQRSLPRTIFSRSFFSLLMPGSGRGFLFAIANVWACSLVLLLACFFDEKLLSQEWIEQYSRMMRRPGTPMPPRKGMGIEVAISAIVNCLFVTWFLSVAFLFARRVFEKRVRDWNSGTGPLISLIFGGLCVALLTIGSFVAHFNFSRYEMRNEMSIWLIPNWYWSVTEISQGNTYFNYVVMEGAFFLLVMIVSLYAFLVAARDLMEKPIEVPKRVAIELERIQPALAKGESIDEIFGELTPGNEN